MDYWLAWLKAGIVAAGIGVGAMALVLLVAADELGLGFAALYAIPVAAGIIVYTVVLGSLTDLVLRKVTLGQSWHYHLAGFLLGIDSS